MRRHCIKFAYACHPITLSWGVGEAIISPNSWRSHKGFIMFDVLG